MYRLLFADDEHIVREGVSSRVGWGENGFELVSVFRNGREILEYLEDNSVDVILSDISMPLMDGLAVCREVSVRYPETILLLLTGYDQFEYAQEALKYHVSELLLKPITAAELEIVLGRVRDELDQRGRVARDTVDELELSDRLADVIAQAGGDGIIHLSIVADTYDMGPTIGVGAARTVGTYAGMTGVMMLLAGAIWDVDILGVTGAVFSLIGAAGWGTGLALQFTGHTELALTVSGDVITFF